MEFDSLVQEKKRLRAQLRQKRTALTPVARRKAAIALIREARRSRLIWNVQKVGVYSPVGSEISPLPLIQFLAQRGVRVYYPIVPPLPARKMLFRRPRHVRAWQPNRFGIPEPFGRVCPVSQLDAVLVPLVGFDARGFRLGQGGGFYDATLACRRRRPWKRPHLIGLAYAIQQCEKVPVEPWDQPLDSLLTEKGFFKP